MFKIFFVSSFLTMLLACIHVHSAPIPAHLRNTFRSIQAREVYTGGNATYYMQNGVAGACGQVNPDTALIAAMDEERYGDLSQVSPLCGKYVKITNINNQKTVTVKVADACPTCNGANSIDLSHGAFTQIATTEEGEVPISWEYVDGDDSSSSTNDDTDSGTDSNSGSDAGSDDDWHSDNE